MAVVQAAPKPVTVDWAKTALILIDMQRDFLEPGGFGSSLGNDVTKLQRAVEPCKKLLSACRAAKMTIIHTREGHLPDMSDVPTVKLEKSEPGMRIGDPARLGRILIIGEQGQDLISELYPIAGEELIDKPGKGAFYNTRLGTFLEEKDITTLLVCGVTTEVCVHTTIREANDRGYMAICVSDCCSSYFDEFHEVGLKMISAQGGIFGAVADCDSVVKALEGGN